VTVDASASAVPPALTALTEAELVRDWPDAESDEPLVTVCCMAFNHEATVADALEGILAQRTAFRFEVLVQDDASTDGTAAIVARYADSHPRVVTALLRDENLYSRNGKTLGNVLPHARGRWIAVCEADDYWSDPNKLAAQIAALERTGAELSLHPAVEVDTRTGRSLPAGRLAERDDLLPPGATLAMRTPPYAAAVYAREALDRYESFRDAHHPPLGDVFMMAFGSRAGGVAYLDRPMSVYRRYLPGSWTTTHTTDYAGAARHSVRMITALDGLAVDAPELAGAIDIRRRRIWTRIPRSLQKALAADQLSRRGARAVWPRGSRAPFAAQVARWAAILLPAHAMDAFRRGVRRVLRRA
jgi:hypothetical protein